MSSRTWGLLVVYLPCWDHMCPPPPPSFQPHPQMVSRCPSPGLEASPESHKLSHLPLVANTRRVQRQWRRFWLWDRFFLARINVTSSASNSSAFCPNFLSMNTKQSSLVVLHIHCEDCTRVRERKAKMVEEKDNLGQWNFRSNRKCY